MGETNGVLIGTYTGGEAGPAGVSRGLYIADWDGEAGVLGAPRLLAELKHPSFVALHPSRPIVYAVSETGQFEGFESGAVAAVRLGGGKAVVGPWRRSGGTGPCHVAVDPQGEYLVVSNYSSGSAAVYPLENGLPAEEGTALRFEGHGPDPKRQEGPHAHSATFDPSGNRFYVMDLGTDLVRGFALDRAAKTARPLDPRSTAIEPGSGPRHMTFHPSGRWAYLINEMGNTVTAFEWERVSGKLEPFQTVTTLPAGRPATAKPSWTADIHVSPDGLFLYGSNRGDDSLAVWSVSKDGTLTLVEIVPCGGGHPRNFTLSPDGRWLLCANMHSHNIVVFRRDSATGRLTRGSETAATSPTCLVFLPAGLRETR
ncbi:MAG: lactonase family protein [Candidatus Coatesbacteria bacterium]